MKRYKIPSLYDEDIEFKLLSAEEADSLFQTISKDDNPYLEEYIFNMITEDKYINKDVPAGIIPTVVYTCLKLSGVIKSKRHFLDLIEEARVKIDKNSFMSLYARIASIQPSYNLDTLRTKSLAELTELIAFSELLIGKQVIDTKKAKELLEKEEENSKAVGAKKGVGSLTTKDIDAIKQAIMSDNFEMI